MCIALPLDVAQSTCHVFTEERRVPITCALGDSKKLRLWPFSGHRDRWLRRSSSAALARGRPGLSAPLATRARAVALPNSKGGARVSRTVGALSKWCSRLYRISWWSRVQLCLWSLPPALVRLGQGGDDSPSSRC